MKQKIVVGHGIKEKHDHLNERIVQHVNEQESANLKNGVARIKVDRKNVFASLKHVARLTVASLQKAEVKVSYVGEQGVDVGGIFRDYMKEIAKAIRISDLFSPGPDGGLLPAQGVAEARLEQLFAVGRLLALAVTSRTPIDLQCSRCLYKVLIGEKITASDVSRIDRQFAEHRVGAVLKKNGVASVEAAICEPLTFVGVHRDGVEEEELLPGGHNRRVTEENKKEYVSLLVEHYLIGRNRTELAVLVAGFHDIIPRRIVQGDALRAIDLELIVVGLPDIDVEDWKLHTEGTLNFNKDLEGWFWEVLEEMSFEDRAKVLSFTCGSGRLPAEGFSGLSPKFRVNVSAELPDHLPIAHTCFNNLELPPYTSKEELEARLKTAVDQDAGFGFM